MADTERITWREKGQTLYRVASYRPKFTAALVVLSGFVAALKGMVV